MNTKYKVAAVNYSNTLPFLHGLEQKGITNKIELITDYPAQIAKLFKNREVDIALLPVAAILDHESIHLFSEFGIAASKSVASVALFSHVPLEKIESISLDFQSRSSVMLCKLLAREYWKIQVNYVPAEPNFISQIKDNHAAVIIGDRALEQLGHFPFVYDLASAWQEYTQLPFVFATWMSNSALESSFIKSFEHALAYGVAQKLVVAERHTLPYYDLTKYYTENIDFRIGDAARKGMNLFLDKIKNIKDVH